MLERARIPPGVLTPAEVYVPPLASRARVASVAAAVPGVHAVLIPGGPGWQRLPGWR
jgi:hypothetical protein